MSVEDNYRRQSAVTSELDNVSQSSLDEQFVNELKMVEHNLVVHETENGVCVVLWQLSETTAPIDDGDLAAADQFTCNALDYKLLFTLNKKTAMFNISILTEGKQCQRFNI